MARRHRGSAPVALVSRSALARNASTLPSAPAGKRIADLRHDAWGHGAALVARELIDHGIDAVLVDADARDRLAADLAAVRVVTTGMGNVDLRALYGLPGASTSPVMRLTGSVLLVKALHAGEGVSYGYLHRASSDTNVALVTGGYAQGIVRALGGRISVEVGGAARPVLGRVAMDACVVDIAELPVERGDEVVFFGDPAAGHPSLGDWVSASGLRAEELVTAVGLRARREVVA
ncbi:hypothetical protein GCM10009739_29300 [Microbacterium ulmi]